MGASLSILLTVFAQAAAPAVAACNPPCAAGQYCAPDGQCYVPAPAPPPSPTQAPGQNPPPPTYYQPAQSAPPPTYYPPAQSTPPPGYYAQPQQQGYPQSPPPQGYPPSAGYPPGPYGQPPGVYQPQRVLAVTFTARAAGEMRTRLRDLGVGGVQARTFHAAAMRQLRYFAPRVLGGPMPELVENKLRLVAAAASRSRLSTDRTSLRDLASYLGRELSFPQGAFLMTGTGIVPPDGFSLVGGDVVSIQVADALLENEVAQ